MKVPKPVTVDFETFGIQKRPHYPPLPTSVAIKWPGKKAKWLAWGHASGNNCTWAEARAELAKAWDHKDGVLFQNAKFDIDVAEVHFGLKPPSWDRIHDTMYLLFLDDPHAPSLSLKPSAERYLGMPPDEQDAVVEWLVKEQPIPGVRVSKSPKSPNYAMAYVPFAPGDLAGKYAAGDVERTAELFKLLYERCKKREMLAAYDRERRLMPILLETEREGMRVDLPRLQRDVENYGDWMNRINAWVRKQLKRGEDLNLDSGEQLVNAMVEAGKADPDRLPLTPTGKYKSDKDSIHEAVTDARLTSILQYRAQLKTCLNTFMKPWLETAEASGGFIFTTWHQTRGDKGGARTGRLSSSPNFQNIPKEFAPLFAHEAKGKGLPRCPFKDLPPLPYVRSYVVPFEGHVLIDRDYSQQEPRILAHFDGGQLLEQYLANPWTDFHDFAKAELEKMGLFYERKPVKNTNLGLIYGMGAGKLAAKNGMTVEESALLKKAVLKLYPGLKEMYKEMKLRAASNVPIRTWGGREYYCEPPKMVQGRIRHFDYKLVNVLIQGSAADCTKEAIINFSEAKNDDWKILMNVHDELVVSVPKDQVAEAMQVLQSAMETVQFDVPMLSEGDYSHENWGALKTYDKKGEIHAKAA